MVMQYIYYSKQSKGLPTMKIGIWNQKWMKDWRFIIKMPFLKTIFFFFEEISFENNQNFQLSHNGVLNIFIIKILNT